MEASPVLNVLFFKCSFFTFWGRGCPSPGHHHVFPIVWICSLAFILSEAILEFLGSAEHWYTGAGGHMWDRWELCPRTVELRNEAGKGEGMEGGGDGVYVPCRPGEPAMKPGRVCSEVEVVMGEESQGSSCRPEPKELLEGRPKESKEGGEEVSWSLMELTSSFSWRRHLARRFWNHTWKQRRVSECW